MVEAVLLLSVWLSRPDQWADHAENPAFNP